MNNRTSGGLVKLSLAVDEEQVQEIDAVAEELVPPTSRNGSARYLLGLGLAAHRKRQEEDNRAREMLALVRGAVS